MKTLILAICTAVFLAGACKTKSADENSGHNPEAADAVEDSPNIALYNEVMKIHDEVMPKIEDIYRKKEALKDKIAKTPNMPESQKKAIDATIAKLDSANDSMMDWMHDFSPLPDSVGQDKAREYLENEMLRIKKVRENILNALREAEKN